MVNAKQLKKARQAGAIEQYAALPVRIGTAGQLELLLLTTRGSRRWVIPKGWPMRKLTPAKTAAREAYEEAGVEGTIRPRHPIGYFHAAKTLDSATPPVCVPVCVTVFLLHVARQLETWPEQAERETRWCSPEEAASLVAEPELAALLLSIPEILVREAS